MLKPRGVPHAFWNATDEPARLLEIVSPAGFEDYFREVEAAGEDLGRLSAAAQAYGLDMDVASIPALMERNGLVR